MRKLNVFFLVCVLVLTATLPLPAKDVLTYIRAEHDVKLFDLFELSDGSFLVTGETNGDFSWTQLTPSLLDMSQTVFFQDRLSKPISLDMIGSDKTDGFILRLSADLTSIEQLVKFPGGLVENIQKVKTSNAPGEVTAAMFISGKARSSVDTSDKGYYIARLDGNFVNEIPGSCSWFRFVDAPNVNNFSECFNLMESRHRQNQPWDVDATGRVVYVVQREFSHGRWVKLERLNPDGSIGVMDSAFYQIYYTHYDSLPHDGVEEEHVVSTSQIHYPVSPGDSVEARLRFIDSGGQDSSAWITVVVDSLSSSFYQFKLNSGRSLRSLTTEALDSVTMDENGEERRGLLPMDILFSKEYGASYDPGGYMGHTGPGLNMATARIGDIVIDKRTNHIYFGVTYAVNDNNWTTYTYPDFPCPDMMGMHFESAVVALKDNGAVKWWGRGYNIKGKATGDSEASQFVDKLALDYANNRLVVMQRSYGYSSLGNNFFNGNLVQANQGANAFQNEWTGDVKKTEISWLGVYELDSLLLYHATYLGEYKRLTTPEGSPLTDPNLHAWPNPNEGNPDLGRTVCYDMKVNENGDVIVACTGERVITSVNAYQQMIKPDLDGIIDSIPPVTSAFVRMYSGDLSSVSYSSVLTGDWDPQTGIGGANTSLQAVWPVQNKILVTGRYAGVDQQLRASHPHTWGTGEVGGPASFVAELSVAPKIAIESYPKVLGFDTDYQLEFDSPNEFSFDPGNVFKVELSMDGTFDDYFEAGSVESVDTNSVSIKIPSGALENGAYYLRIKTDKPAVYSQVVKVHIPAFFCSDALSLTFVPGDSLSCKETVEEYAVNNVCGIYTWSIIPPQAGEIISAKRDSNVIAIRWNDFIGDASLVVSSRGADSSGLLQTIYSDTLSLYIYGFDSYIVADSVEKSLTAFPNKPDGAYEFQWRTLSGNLSQGWTADSIFDPVKDDGSVTVWVRNLNTGCVSVAPDTVNLYGRDGDNSIYALEDSIRALTVYPNPAQNVLQIILPNELRHSGVESTLYNMKGELIDKKNLVFGFSSAQRVYVIDISVLNRGAYIVFLSDEILTFSAKFFKE